MREHYDFSGARKNLHAGKMKNGYTIVVEHKDYDEIITVKKTRQEKNTGAAEKPKPTEEGLPQ